MKIGKFKITTYITFTDSSIWDWKYLTPCIEYRHKYRGLWEFAFSWLWKKNLVLQIEKLS